MNPSEFRSSRKFADTPFGRIAYIEQGAGPATLFLHGLPLCGYQWRGVIEDLAPVRRCIALDEIGLGYTEVAAGQEVSFAAQARMIAAFLDAAKIDTEITQLGQTPVGPKDFAGWSAKITTGGTRRLSAHGQRLSVE